MRLSSKLLALSLAAFAPTLPAQADAVGFSVCSSNTDGTQQVGLLLIQGGTRTFVPVGFQGLTETIARNEFHARQWIENSGLVPSDSYFTDYAGYICGMQVRDDGNRAPTPQVNIVDPDPEDEGEGNGNGNQNGNEDGNQNGNGDGGPTGPVIDLIQERVD